MTPYGIVYKDNPYGLQKSIEIWQKKYGVFNLPAFLKIGGICASILFIINLLSGLFTEYGVLSYMGTFVVMTVLTFVIIYIIVKNTYIRQMALTNTQKEDKQIVLYEDRLEYGTGYTRATYYYSDIIYCHESAETISIITDTAAIPLSVQKSSVSKGSYDKFSFILRSCIGNKYEYMGGNK